MTDLKPVLAVDVDEVLYPLVQLFVEYHNNNHDTDAVFEQFYSYSFEKSLGLPKDKFIERIASFAEQGNFASKDPIEGTKIAIAELSKHYDLQIVTSRWESWQQHTITWLQSHFPDTFSEVHFANSIPWQRGEEYSKLAICKRIGAQYFIDDSLENATDVAAGGIKSFLFGDYPWNQTAKLPENVSRVKDWNEVLEILL